MEGLTGHRVWRGATVALLFGLILTWALLRFGAAETPVLYQTFLVLIVPCFLVLTAPFERVRVDLRYLVLVLVGLLLLGQTALQPTLEARGYIHLAVGWIALWICVWLAVGAASQRRFLLVVLVLLGVLEAFYGLIQSVGGFDYIGGYFRNKGRIATGTLINRNHYAALLNMLLPLALGMLSSDTVLKRSQRSSRSESLAKTWLVLLGCSIMGVAVLLSQSRGGTLSLLMTLLFMALLFAQSRRRRRHRGMSAAAAAVLILLVLGMGGAFGLEALMERFEKVEEGVSRVEIYRDTLGMLRDSPVIGVGPGMYEWRFRLYQTSQADRLYDHAHSDYLETATEWGIPLALLIWGLLLWRFYRSTETALSERDPVRQGVALGTAGALFSISIHSLVDFSLQIPAILMVFACVVALSWSLEFQGPKPEPVSGPENGVRFNVAELALRVLLALALLAAGWQTLGRARALAAASPENGIEGLERAVELDPKGAEPSYLLAMAYRDLPGAGDPGDAIEQFQQSVRLNPYAWRYWLELSRAQELARDLDQAEASLRVAVSLNPGSGEYRWRLANLLLRQGDLDGAVDEVDTAVELEPALAEAALFLLVKAGADPGSIEKLLPDDQVVLLRVLRSVIRTRSISQEGPLETLTEAVWSRLLAQPDSLSFGQGRSYPDHLFRSGRYQQARRRWLELAEVGGMEDPAFAAGGNRVWNGDFELELLGDPMGWRVGRSEAFKAARVPNSGPDSSVALRVEFLGQENLSFGGVSQELLLESGEPYRLTLWLRSEELTTDQGVFAEIVSRDPAGPLFSSESMLGSTEWSEISGQFSMPAGSGRALIRLRRLPSQQIDNRLRGNVYLDSVRIEQVNR